MAAHSISRTTQVVMLNFFALINYKLLIPKMFFIAVQLLTITLLLTYLLETPEDIFYRLQKEFECNGRHREPEKEDG